MKKDPTPRSVAQPQDGTGSTRYRMLKDGAHQAAKAYTAGFFLEAIVLTEGMLWCRIASRYEWLVKKSVTADVRSWNLLEEMQKFDHEEHGARFADLSTCIKNWLKFDRNPLAHGAAKLLDKSGPDFATNMQHAREAAEIGFRILVDWDTLDMQSRIANGWEVDRPDSKVRPPASYPDAFDSIRQLLNQPALSQVLGELRRSGV